MKKLFKKLLAGIAAFSMLALSAPAYAMNADEGDGTVGGPRTFWRVISGSPSILYPTVSSYVLGNVTYPIANAYFTAATVSALTISSISLGFTPCSVAFIGATGNLTQDNANFCYTDSTDKLSLTGAFSVINSTLFTGTTTTSQVVIQNTNADTSGTQVYISSGSDADSAAAAVVIATTHASHDQANLTLSKASDTGMNWLAFVGSGNDYAIGLVSGLIFKNINAGVNSLFLFVADDGDGTDDVKLKTYAKGTTGAFTNTEYLELGYEATGTQYQIASVAAGTGTVRDLVLYTGANTNQLRLDDLSTISQTSTLNQGTGDEVAYTLNYTTNKATSGNDTGLSIIQTDTASPGTSYLLNALVGAGSKFSITNTGLMTAYSNIVSQYGWFIVDSMGYGLYSSVAGVTTTTGNIMTVSALARTNTSGTQAYFAIVPTYNQASGTAANTDLLINRTQTAVGSGNQYLIDAQVSTVSKFSVRNDGVVVASGTLVGGTNAFAATTSHATLWNAGQYTWSGAASALTGSLDTGLERVSAGVVGVTNGSTGEGSLSALKVKVGDGTSAAVSYEFGQGANWGIFNSSTLGIGFSIAGVVPVAITQSWVQLIGTAQLAWNDTAPDASPNAGIERVANAVLRITNGTTGIGALLNARNVEANTGTKVPTLTESNEVYTNTGDADGSGVTLPNDPTAGVMYTIAVTVAQTVTILPDTNEDIFDGADACLVSLTSNAIGSTITLMATVGGDDGDWFVTSKTGTWACNDA